MALICPFCLKHFYTGRIRDHYYLERHVKEHLSSKNRPPKKATLNERQTTINEQLPCPAS